MPQRTLSSPAVLLVGGACACACAGVGTSDSFAPAPAGEHASSGQPAPGIGGGASSDEGTAVHAASVDASEEPAPRVDGGRHRPDATADANGVDGAPVGRDAADDAPPDASRADAADVGDGDASVPEAGDAATTDAAPLDARACDDDGDGHMALSCGGDDCCDLDDGTHPGVTAWYATPDRCGSLDRDCTGTVDVRWTPVSCRWDGVQCVGAGLGGATACGEQAVWQECTLAGPFCVPAEVDWSQPLIVQTCR